MTSERTRNRLIDRLRDQGIDNERLLEAMRTVPRHLFIDDALSHRAYEDTALPIGGGQTISQPYIVARMTQELLKINPRRVLEIGTGCGYQTAILAQLCDRVYSIERLDSLHRQARKTLAGLSISNVMLQLGDGYLGWPVAAPFDAIIITAAPPSIPEKLLSQMQNGGKMIVPVGSGRAQTLQLLTREGDQFFQDDLEAVSFVPMIAGDGR